MVNFTVLIKNEDKEFNAPNRRSMELNNDPKTLISDIPQNLSDRTTAKYNEKLLENNERIPQNLIIGKNLRYLIGVILKLDLKFLLFGISSIKEYRYCSSD